MLGLFNMKPTNDLYLNLVKFCDMWCVSKTKQHESIEISLMIPL